MSNENKLTLEARPAVVRVSVHPSITEGQISALVEEFYAEILKHPRLGPIFKSGVTGAWDEHLCKMKAFWRSVLLRSGEYKGKPVPAHQKIEGLIIQDFEQWLAIFATVAQRIFSPEATVLVMEAAGRIATSLWLSRTNDIFASPPDWQLTQLGVAKNNQKETTYGSR